MRLISTHRCFNGALSYYSHASHSTQCDMRLSVFVPPSPTGAALIYLSGLTCSEENFTVKAGAYRAAAQHGLTIIAPDTSPRGDHVPNHPSIALGQGAGFYIDATQEPWCQHYKMHSYIAHELPPLLTQHFNVHKFGLCGHSMGGHGALTIALRHRHMFYSVSALAPICQLSRDGWGPTVLQAYIGDDKALWLQYDACALMKYSTAVLSPILIHQGTADEPYLQGRLNPQAFADVCRNVAQPLELILADGYDHGYFFVQTFIDAHVAHHASLLNG